MSEQDQHDLIPVDFDPFAEGELSRTISATESQKEIWTAAQLGDDANCAFNESVSLRFKGELDMPALLRALELLVERHEALRTTLSPDGETLCVAPVGVADVTSRDWSAQDPDHNSSALESLIHEAVKRPFDLEHGPLARFWLVKLSDSLSELIISAHHIVCDGWSTAVLLEDLGSLYAQTTNSASPLTLPSATPFSAYADRLTQIDNTENCEFWTQKFHRDVPVLDWPTDEPRPALRTFESARIDTRINQTLVSDLKDVAARHKVSFFALLLAAWEAYVSRLTGAGDVVTGIPAAGQSAAGLPGVVGHCVNLLPVRSHIQWGESFSELLAKTQSALLDAFDHQEYTFGSLLKQIPMTRDPSRVPVVPIQFNLDQSIDPEKLGFPDLEVEFRSNPRAFENFEIFINLTESAGSLEIATQYNTNLFHSESIRRRLAGFEVLLRTVADQPEIEIGRLPTVAADERSLVLESWNKTAQPHDASVKIHEIILGQAERTPESIALECGNDRITYRALQEDSLILSNRLMEIGVRPGDLVGLALERSIEMVVAAVAIWRCGAAYVPLDPEFPPQRIRHMVKDSDLATLVTTRSLAESLPEVRLGGPVFVDEVPSEGFRQRSVDQPSDEDARAYVIYTSGSTGTPKGVEVPHRAVVNFLETMARNPGLGPQDRLVAVTTLSFDISVLELFLPLTVGACTIVATEAETRDGRALRKLLEQSHASTMQATPATWRLLSESGWRGGSGFTALCGGEAFPADLAKELSARAARVFNMYGPTETTIWSTLHELNGEETTVPIGQPIGNTQVYVLDNNLEPTGVGVPGELFIGGEGLTLGYLGKPELTEERFIDNPFRAGDRLYRTGDFVRWDTKGRLVFSRRLDSQVKVRGYRIELGEIESALADHPSVAEAVVMVYERDPGDTRLAAYCVSAASGLADASALRAHLGQRLPAYMVPQHFISLDSIPLTPNKKADRKALPLPDVDQDAGRQYREPAPGVERELALIWSEVLNVDQVGADEDFFDLGGHSILATRVVAQVSERMGVELPLRRIFATPGLAALAEYIDALGVLGQGVSLDRGESKNREEVSF